MQKLVDVDRSYKVQNKYSKQCLAHPPRYVKNALIWKENARKNAQKVENFPVGMFNYLRYFYLSLACIM